MAFDLVRSEAFESDVFDVLTYFVEKQASPLAGSRMMEAVDKAVARISENPFLYAVSRRPELESGGLRECLVGRYTIVYRVEGNSVLLLRFLHQARDFGSLVVEW